MMKCKVLVDGVAIAIETFTTAEIKMIESSDNGIRLIPLSK